MANREYHKLVRDNIPHIIEENGGKAETRILSRREYARALREKLLEEAGEYLQSGQTEELADLLEVIYAIAEHKGIGTEELEEIRLRKKRANGGFHRRIYLESVADD